MRITPLICWHCSCWFMPKTKRKNKYCSNACRQQGFLKNKHSAGYPNLVQFHDKDGQGHNELADALSNACSDGYKNCVECLFEKDNNKYSMIVAKYGIDYMGNTMNEWLKLQKSIL